MKVTKLKKNGKVVFDFTRTEAFLLKQIRREFWPGLNIADTVIRLLEINLRRRRAPWHYSAVPEAVTRFRYEVRCTLQENQ